MPVFMPCPPVGGWTCAASPAMKQLPTRYLSASRMEMPNSEDQRRSAKRDAPGSSRSATACNCANDGPGRSDEMPCPVVTPAGESSGGANMDTR